MDVSILGKMLEVDPDLSLAVAAMRLDKRAPHRDSREKLRRFF